MAIHYFSINFFLLCKYSQLIRDKYLILDAKSHLSQDIQVFIQENDITPEVASSFLISIKEENLKVTSDNFLEFSKLSKFPQVKRFLKKLNHFYQLQKNDPDFYINAIINDINAQKIFSDSGFQTLNKFQRVFKKKKLASYLFQ